MKTLQWYQIRDALNPPVILIIFQDFLLVEKLKGVRKWDDRREKENAYTRVEATHVPIPETSEDDSAADKGHVLRDALCTWIRTWKACGTN